MQSLELGITGLNAAQAALDVIGNNIANAATEGYHRQRIELAPVSSGETAAGSAGAGVDVAGVTRMIDELLEREIVRQGSAYGQISQELSVLRSVETTFGEFSEGGSLNAAIDGFFDTLRGLAAHPLEQVWRNETINAAETLANEFRRLGTSLDDLDDQIILETKNSIESINALISQIAEMNGNIQATEVSGGQANNLRDQRDQLVADLGRLIGIEVQPRDFGTVDVSVGGLPVVAGTVALGLALGMGDGQSLSVLTAGAEGRTLDVQGGRLGGLLTLKNTLLGGLQGDLDTLAKAIIDQINQNHVQGLGQEGSFTQLSGWTLDNTDLAANSSITDGAFHVRLTNTATGAVQRYAIAVNVSGPAPDTLASVAAKIDSITGLNASVISARLHLVADAGYTFDFLPAVLPEPTTAALTAAAPPTVAVSGLYRGEENSTFRFTVAGTGSVGNGTLRLQVANQDGDIVDTLNIGIGYAAGDAIELANGIRISLSRGALNDGDSFTVEALATTDTAGFLAATGMNTFFSGSSAADMRVEGTVAERPDRIATALGGALTDNHAALRLAAVREQAMGELSGMTPSEYYDRTVAGLAQQVALKQSRQYNLEAVMQNLEKRRSDLGAVNINDEAAQLVVFEQMFQAMAKYLNTVQTTMTTLMNMV